MFDDHDDEDDTPGIGHNTATDDRLRLLVERIERLESEKQEIAEDVREVYQEVKAVGYDPKIVRQIIKIRKMNADDRREQEALLEVYCAALGIV